LYENRLYGKSKSGCQLRTKLFFLHKIVRGFTAPWALALPGLNFEGSHGKYIAAMGTQKDSAAVIPVIAGT
jgi:hypothetical protein